MRPIAATPRLGADVTMRVVACTLLALLVACASGGKVDIPGDRVFRLTGLMPQAQPNVKLTDGRPEDARVSRALPNGLVVGDDRIEPTPPQAVVAELQRSAGAHAQAANLVRVFAAHNVQLDRLEVTIIGTDLTNARSAGQPPGIAAVDSLMRSLAQATLGGTDVTVNVSVTIAGRSLSAVGKGTYTASPGPDAVARPFYRAMQTLADQIAASSF
jgi:hypothetical protein